MTDLSPPTLHALGWTLLHFVWQGAALGALFAVLLATSRKPNVRYAIGVATLILMMVVPALTFVWLTRAPAPVAPIATSMMAGITDLIASDPAVQSERVAQVLASGANRQEMMTWLVQAWLVGVMLFSARTAGGWLWLRRAGRGQIEALPDEVYRQCLSLQRRMGLNRHIRFGQCRWLDAPAVLGCFRPVVLVTTQALTGLSLQQLQAVIAHELAHIRRHDAFVNLLQIAAEMFLFYHPAVWWVSRRIRIEREVCCDHEALGAGAEPVNYARALTLMEEWRVVPSTMMASNRGPLSERVLRLLGAQGTSARSRAVGVGISVTCFAAALFAGNVLVAAAQAPDQSDAAAPKRQPSYIDRLAAVGLKGLSIDELIAMKVQDITPEYIEGMRAMRFDPNVDELIAMKVQGVTPDYVDEIRRLIADPGIEDLIAMKVHGITPGFIRDLQAAGLDLRTADDLIAVAVHDITPEFVKTALDHGFQDLTVDKLIMLRSADVI